MKHKKTINFEVKHLSMEERILRFIGSSEDKDRDGDIILSSGWDLTNYKKNPVFLWAHDYSIPPIGRALRVEVERDKLVFDVEFPQKGIHSLADTVYELYKDGFMNATSVGFIGKEKHGDKFIKQELLELSAVPVPSNPMALQQAKSLGYIKQGANQFFEDDYIFELIEDEHIEIDMTLNDLKKAVAATVNTAIRGGRS